MAKITRDSLMSLETYAVERVEFRTKVLKHKENRRLFIGDNALMLFEDEMTMRYQVQEMLRIEKVFEVAGIEEELGAYNPLIPDGKNWKVTFMMEYTDVDQRHLMLGKLIGIEDKVWVQAADFSRVYAIADEDMERDNADKTSAVHFLRFELTDEMCTAIKTGAAISMGIDHENFDHSVEPLPENIRDSIAADLA